MLRRLNDSTIYGLMRVISSMILIFIKCLSKLKNQLILMHIVVITFKIQSQGLAYDLIILAATRSCDISVINTKLKTETILYWSYFRIYMEFHNSTISFMIPIFRMQKKLPSIDIGCAKRQQSTYVSLSSQIPIFLLNLGYTTEKHLLLIFCAVQVFTICDIHSM